MKIKKSKYKNINYTNIIFLINPIKRKTPIKRMPQYLKFKRYFKIGLINTQSAYKNQKTKLNIGFLGLQATQSGYLLLEHIDILKKFLSPKTKNTYTGSHIINLCIKLFPIRILTQKPLQSRIGRGKGLPTKWYCKIYKNDVLLEFRELVNYYKCKALLQTVIKKITIKNTPNYKKRAKNWQRRLRTCDEKKITMQCIYIA